MRLSIRDMQISRNRDSRDRWPEYADHRERITQLLIHSAPVGGRLLVLGAGNCNDIDLSKLLNTFAEVHLADLDSEALNEGVLRQNVQRHPAVTLHGGIDLMGITEVCSKWKEGTSPDVNEIGSVLNLARHHEWPYTKDYFDVTASVGLLSQLTETVILSIGEAHPRMMDLLRGVRSRHMQLLLETARVGGRAILITELVSSSSYPGLRDTSQADLTDVLHQLIAGRNFFTGLNPVVLKCLWQESPELAPLVEQVQLSSPWLWNFGPRVYACYALSGIRRSVSSL